jgi:hypothetical protein
MKGSIQINEAIDRFKEVKAVDDVRITDQLPVVPSN